MCLESSEGTGKQRKREEEHRAANREVKQKQTRQESKLLKMFEVERKEEREKQGDKISRWPTNLLLTSVCNDFWCLFPSLFSFSFLLENFSQEVVVMSFFESSSSLPSSSRLSFSFKCFNNLCNLNVYQSYVLNIQFLFWWQTCIQVNLQE